MSLGDFNSDDAQYLMGKPEFRRFLFAAIQSAGVLGDHVLADGPQERDLRFHEGRRSLGFELLQAADHGQPEPLQTPHALATLNAVILESMNPAPKEKKSGRRDDTERYAELPDD